MKWKERKIKLINWKIMIMKKYKIEPTGGTKSKVVQSWVLKVAQSGRNPTTSAAAEEFNWVLHTSLKSIQVCWQIGTGSIKRMKELKRVVKHFYTTN